MKDAKNQQNDQPATGGTNKKRFQLRKKQLTSWGPVSAILVTLGIYFGSQLLAGLTIGLYGDLSGYAPEQIVSKVEGSSFFQFLYILLVSLLTILLLWWFLRHRKIKLSQIGLGRLPVGSDVSNAFITFGLYFLVLIAAMAVVGGLFTGLDLDQKQQIGFEGVSGFGPLALVFISLVLLPSVVEEILVRGFLYGGLRNKLRPITAAVVTSFIFAIAHLQFGSGDPLLWAAAIDTFILSMFLIRLREKTGSLWSGMMVHFVKNGLAFTSLFILAV